MPRRCNILPGRSGTTLIPQAIVSGIIASALVPPRSTLRGSTAIDRLADDMRESVHIEGGVSRHDLKLLGWTTAQLDEHGDRALIRAQKLSTVS